MFDPKPVIDLAFQVVDGVVVTVVVPVLAFYLMRKLHIDTQSALGQRVLTTAQNAAALGLAKAQSEADSAAHPIEIRQAAVAKGLDYLNEAISAKTITAAKITVPLEQLVEAQVAKLQLAPPVDTTVPAPVVGVAMIKAPPLPAPPAPQP